MRRSILIGRTGRAACIALLGLGMLLLGLSGARANGWEHGAIPFDSLVSGLAADIPETRKQAAISLGFRQQPEAIAPLIDALRRPEDEPAVRSALYRALGVLGAAKAMPLFETCLETETRAELRGDCATALGGLAGGPFTDTARDRLIALVAQDESPLVAKRAVDALGNFSDRTTVAVLARIAGAPLTDGPPLPDDLPRGGAEDLARRAVAALGATGHPAAGTPLTRLLEAAPDDSARLPIVRALIRIGPRDASEPLSALTGTDHSPKLRISATVALAAIGDGAVRPRIETLLQDDSPPVRYTAIQALRGLGDPDAAPALTDFLAPLTEWLAQADGESLLASPREAIRRLSLIEAAIQALIALEPGAGTRAMAPAAAAKTLGNDSTTALSLAAALYRVRRAALYGLGYSADPKAVAPVLRGEHGIGDPDPRLRAVAARSIGVLGGEDATRTLLPLLQDPSPEVRWTAARTLGYLGHKAAIEPLIGRFGDGDSRVRAAAAEALANLGAIAAIPAIRRRVEAEERPPARRAAEAALERLERLEASE